MIFFYLPTNFDVQAHIAQYPPKSIKDFDSNKLLYLIHLINFLPAVNEKARSTAGYTYLYSDLLKAKFSNFKDYLRYLIETDVIEQLRNSYSTDEHFSKSYRINSKKFNLSIIKQRVDGNTRFLTSLGRLSEGRKKELRKLQTEFKYLTKWLEMG